MFGFMLLAPEIQSWMHIHNADIQTYTAPLLSTPLFPASCRKPNLSVLQMVQWRISQTSSFKDLTRSPLVRELVILSCLVRLVSYTLHVDTLCSCSITNFRWEGGCVRWGWSPPTLMHLNAMQSSTERQTCAGICVFSISLLPLLYLFYSSLLSLPLWLFYCFWLLP